MSLLHRIHSATVSAWVGEGLPGATGGMWGVRGLLWDQPHPGAQCHLFRNQELSIKESQCKRLASLM